MTALTKAASALGTKTAYYATMAIVGAWLWGMR